MVPHLKETGPKAQHMNVHFTPVHHLISALGKLVIIQIFLFGLVIF